MQRGMPVTNTCLVGVHAVGSPTRCQCSKEWDGVHGPVCMICDECEHDWSMVNVCMIEDEQMTRIV